jgi:hypothetical protein
MKLLKCSHCEMEYEDTPANFPVVTADGEYACCKECYDIIEARNQEMAREADSFTGGPKLWERN